VPRRRRTWRERHLHRRAGSGCLSRPCPGRTEVRTNVRRRPGWRRTRHGHDRAWGNHWSLQWWGCRIGTGHRHRGVCRDDWRTVCWRHRACAGRRPSRLRRCILRIRHGHCRRDKLRCHMVGGSSQRRHGVLVTVTRSTVEKTTTASSAGSNVAVRGWLLWLGFVLGHVSCATYPPGIVLRTRKLGEEGSEGCA
jgi:hypothetical protein